MHFVNLIEQTELHEHTDHSDYFILPPAWLLESISRKKAFVAIPEPVVDFAIDHRDLFGRWLQLPSPSETCEPKNYRQQLYLVFCELNNHSFYKIGLTAHDNPIRRDPNVYKRVVSCHEVDPDWAHIYEMYCLWRCKQIRGKKPWDAVEFAWWPGKSEMIRSTDKRLPNIFLDAYNEINSIVHKLTRSQVQLEFYLLDKLINAIYSERYTTSSLAVFSFVAKILHKFGENHGGFEDPQWITLHPIAKQYLVKRLTDQLAPIVDRKWDQNHLRCPVARFHAGKRLYEDWCYETWGESCWSNAKPYRDMITRNDLTDPLVEKLESLYKGSTYKVYAKQQPSKKPPAKLNEILAPRLPQAGKKKRGRPIILHPTTITITYQDSHGDSTLRKISIIEETKSSLKAFCHLRQEERIFAIINIRTVQQEDGAECWGQRFFYTRRVGTPLEMKHSRGLDIDTQEEAYKMATKITKRSQLEALEEKTDKAETRCAEARTDKSEAIAWAKYLLLEEAREWAWLNYYDAEYCPCLISSDSLFLTLFQLSYVDKLVSFAEYRKLRKAYPELSQACDWTVFDGHGGPGVNPSRQKQIDCLVEFRTIIESPCAQDEKLNRIDSLAYSKPREFNQYFNLRGKRSPSEQWLILQAKHEAGE